MLSTGRASPGLSEKEPFSSLTFRSQSVKVCVQSRSSWKQEVLVLIYFFQKNTRHIFLLVFPAQERLAELQGEAADAERRVLKATETLRQVQDAAAQRKVSAVDPSSPRVCGSIGVYLKKTL